MVLVVVADCEAHVLNDCRLPTHFFDDCQPDGEKAQIFLKLLAYILATHPPSLTSCEERLAFLILAGTPSQTRKFSPFFLLNHKKHLRENTVVQALLTLI